MLVTPLIATTIDIESYSDIGVDEIYRAFRFIYLAVCLVPPHVVTSDPCLDLNELFGLLRVKLHGLPAINELVPSALFTTVSTASLPHLFI